MQLKAGREGRKWRWASAKRLRVRTTGQKKVRLQEQEEGVHGGRRDYTDLDNKKNCTAESAGNSFSSKLLSVVP